MAAEPYRVSQLVEATRQLRSILACAKARGMLDTTADAITTAIRHLKTDPSNWGDPLHRTKKVGGMVRRGFISPVIVHFAVYEAERSVLVLSVKPLPGHGLD
jgi:hypothetical protein